MKDKVTRIFEASGGIENFATLTENTAMLDVKPIGSSGRANELDISAVKMLDKFVESDIEEFDTEELDEIMDAMEALDFEELAPEVQEYYNKIAEYLNERYRKIFKLKGGSLKMQRQKLKTKAAAHRDTLKKKHAAGYRTKVLKKKRKEKRGTTKRKRKKQRKLAKRRRHESTSSLAQDLKNIQQEAVLDDTNQAEILERIERITELCAWFIDDEEAIGVIEDTIEDVKLGLTESMTEEQFRQAIRQPIFQLDRIIDEIEKNS